MKQPSSDSLSSDSSNAKRRRVSPPTYHKWKTEMDKECNTLLSLGSTVKLVVQGVGKRWKNSGAGGRKTVEEQWCRG